MSFDAQKGFNFAETEFTSTVSHTLVSNLLRSQKLIY